MNAPAQIPPVSRLKPGKQQTLSIRAYLLGGRIDTRSFEMDGAISTAPLTLGLNGGTALLYRYGVVVLVDIAPDVEGKLFADLRARILDPLETVETPWTPIKAVTSI